ncbi:nucleoside recognition domain-containing protein [Clostridium cellulovorans]|uniref:Nucleoside recognition domain protein n=1 Tax=Clostridium cellulovorans (strain ATCC 35296 / DSM 3052 / OCM 3 / 743B) TaxID=573061 RepID=D9SNQ0_CLOC7|nr:nucleoside recognition domain-containing protein [Clostridium cellulovorans]ADL49921.1 nucleoside recognition domain protein [Clostridium cellulovorans 743B]
MINYIWFGLIAIGIFLGIAKGDGEALSKAIIGSTENTVALIIGLTGIMCLWCGVMRIAEKSGLTNKISKALLPVLRIIFKDASKSENAMGAMVMNITSNMMGLSNAATPFGIKAIVELDKINPKKGVATNDMALFLVLNSACVQFVPTTIISLRAAEGSKNPALIIIPAFIASLSAAILGIVYCKILQRYF